MNSLKGHCLTGEQRLFLTKEKREPFKRWGGEDCIKYSDFNFLPLGLLSDNCIAHIEELFLGDASTQLFGSFAQCEASIIYCPLFHCCNPTASETEPVKQGGLVPWLWHPSKLNVFTLCSSLSSLFHCPHYHPTI